MKNKLHPSHDRAEEEENDFRYWMCQTCYICSCCFETDAECEGDYYRCKYAELEVVTTVPKVVEF